MQKDMQEHAKETCIYVKESYGYVKETIPAGIICEREICTCKRGLGSYVKERYGYVKETIPAGGSRLDSSMSEAATLAGSAARTVLQCVTVCCSVL